MKRFGLGQHFNWRVLFLRVLVNALVLMLTAILVPNIYFVDRRFLVLLGLAIVLGVINAFIKPVVQFLVLPFIFATYGVIIVLVNAAVLLFLAALFPTMFAVDGWFWAVVGGVVMGLLGSFLEDLLGVTPPIVPENYDSVRQKIKTQPPVLPKILAQVAASDEAAGSLVVPERPAPAAATVDSLGSPAGAPDARLETSAELDFYDQLVRATTTEEDSTTTEPEPATTLNLPVADSAPGEEQA